MADRPILLVSSNGGHLLQLAQLKDAWKREQRVWVTFDKADSRSMLAGERVLYAYHPTNRSLLNLLRNLWLAARVMAQLHPAAVVTTGAGVAVPFCYVGRLFGAQIVYIESFSRIDEASLTARLVHPVAHRFFVQWPELLPRFRKAEFRGTCL